MASYVTRQGERISKELRELVRLRYQTITRAVNIEFRDSYSDTNNSLYVGSYGRGTAIDTSDIDIIVILPQEEYQRYDSARGNGQSRLLQAVKGAIQTAYPRTDVRADGQVIVVNFSDEMKFEVLPAFKNMSIFGEWDGTYSYPDTNMGGKWRSTDPKAEQNAMTSKNEESKGLLYDTCKHIRRIRDDHFSSYKLSGIIIDSFVYISIGYWHYTDESESSGRSIPGAYESMLLEEITKRHIYRFPIKLTAPGSGQEIDAQKSYECLYKVIKYMAG